MSVRSLSDRVHAETIPPVEQAEETKVGTKAPKRKSGVWGTHANGPRVSRSSGINIDPGYSDNRTLRTTEGCVIHGRKAAERRI